MDWHSRGVCDCGVRKVQTGTGGILSVEARQCEKKNAD